MTTPWNKVSLLSMNDIVPALIDSGDAGGRPSLNLLATEIQLQILRHILKVDVLELSPLDDYCRPKYGLGSLALLRVSKHFSALGLSILCGENIFKTTPARFAICSRPNVAKRGKRCLCDVRGPSLFDHCQQGESDWSFFMLGHQDLKCLRWHIVRDLPKDEPALVSPIDCLDQISQTNPGRSVSRFRILHRFIQMNGKKLQEFSIIVLLGLSNYSFKRFMNGVLPQILQRMRGLQSLELKLGKQGYDWYNLVPEVPVLYGCDSDKWDMQCARRFLERVKKELTHIKTVTLDHSGEEDAPLWMDRQLENRNAFWVPPVPAYKDLEASGKSVCFYETEHCTVLQEITRTSRCS